MYKKAKDHGTDISFENEVKKWRKIQMLDVYIVNALVTVYMKNIQHGVDHLVNTAVNVIARCVNIQERSR